MLTAKLILVDGMAVLYRAYYAVKDLCTSGGVPTNAVFGFIRMMDQMRTLWTPTHWVVVFDGGLPEERLTLLEDYKAQRAPMPDPLREQVGMVEEYLERAGIAWTRQEGQEADDVMASLAHWAETQGAEILIATGDKDMYQLVNDRIHIIAVSGKDVEMGPKEITEKTGAPPSRIVAWISLMGDASDNIPGAPGVGRKTAAKLLMEHGSLDGIWESLGAVKSGKLRDSLRESRSLVERNVEIVRLKTDLGCSLSWTEMELRTPSAEELLPFFDRLEFTAMARKLREPEMF